jgi:hypothetical protein
LGRQCVVCKAQTDRTEQMIPVEAEDIPLVKRLFRKWSAGEGGGYPRSEVVSVS